MEGAFGLVDHTVRAVLFTRFCVVVFVGVVLFGSKVVGYQNGTILDTAFVLLLVTQMLVPSNATWFEVAPISATTCNVESTGWAPSP